MVLVIHGTAAERSEEIWISGHTNANLEAAMRVARNPLVSRHRQSVGAVALSIDITAACSENSCWNHTVALWRSFYQRQADGW